MTEKLLDELGCSGKPVITVLNKCDLPLSDSVPLNIKDSVRISALSGEGIDTLLEAVSKALPPSRARVKMLIPYSDGAAAAAMRKDGVIAGEEYRADGLYLDITADTELVDRYKDYCIRE